MSAMAKRRISVFILAVWMSPAVSALGAGLHLAAEHHGAPGHHGALEHHGDPEHDHAAETHGARSADHQVQFSQLVQAAAHGHHHDAEAAPDHEHQARFDGSAPTLAPSALILGVLSAPSSPASAPESRRLLDRSPRRGPPLFTAHCSLLL